MFSSHSLAQFCISPKSCQKILICSSSDPLIYTTSSRPQRMRRRRVYEKRAKKTHTQHSTIPTVVPQKPMMLSSSVDLKFMPNIPATMAPSAAAKLPMLRVNSSRFTCSSSMHAFMSHVAITHVWRAPTPTHSNTALNTEHRMDKPSECTDFPSLTSKRRAERETPMDSSKSRAPASRRSASL